VLGDLQLHNICEGGRLSIKNTFFRQMKDAIWISYAQPHPRCGGLFHQLLEGRDDFPTAAKKFPNYYYRRKNAY
jgi:hypothetical protein